MFHSSHRRSCVGSSTLRTPSRLWPLLLLCCLCSAALRAETDLPVRVELSGIDTTARDNILATLTIAQQGDRALSPARVRLLHRRAGQQIIDALRPLGYYRATVDGAVERDARQWQARYRITPGAPLPIGQVDLRFTGAAEQDEAMLRLQRELPLKSGEPLRHDQYEAAKKQIQRLAAERGYFTARFTRHQVRIDLDRYQADIQLWFDSGPRHRLGPVRFSDSRISPELLRRYLRQAPGTPYRQSALLRLQERLVDSGYFSQVEVVAQPERAQNDEVPVEVKLFDRKPDRFQIGAGYGTDTGARMRGSYEYQPINPQGHRFDSEAVLSQLNQKIDARHLIPLARPDRDQFITHAGWENDQPPNDSESAAFKFGVGVQQGLGQWRRLIGLDYQSERFQIGDEEGLSQLLMPTLGLTRTQADHPIHVTHGNSLQLSLRGSIEGTLSDATFVQASLKGKRIDPLGEGRLLSRLELGSSWVDEFDQLPPSVRFFAGGDQSVRGHDYKALGPEDADGEVLGGKHLLVGSVEYEHPFNDDWRGAIFIDAGNAFDRFDQPLHRGVGLGLRWKLPVGWVRIDLAHPHPFAEGGWRLHFTMGPDL